jgi:hypothetical protein
VWDPAKPPGLGQPPPLMPEYQKVFEANIAKGHGLQACRIRTEKLATKLILGAKFADHLEGVGKPADR